MFLSCATTALGQSVNKDQLIRDAVANELRSPLITQNCTYQYHRQVSAKQETLLMVKSSDLVVGKLVRIGNTPVSQAQEEKEDQHLRLLLTNSSAREDERTRQQKLENDMRSLVQAIPQAFHFTQRQTEIGSAGHHLVHFDFEPAVGFRPSSASMELLRGMSGTMVIDAAQQQIVKFDAQLFRDVDFGWGILVHLNKGGNLSLDRDVGLSSNIREFSLNVTGRILLLKKLEIHSSFDHFACFRRPIALASAVAMLTRPGD
jgi:hypothetical protein